MSAIKIDQTGLSAGAPGVSRTDGLANGELVLLENVAPSGFTQFRLLWVPPEDDSAVATLAPARGEIDIWEFTPAPGCYGTYLVELLEDGLRIDVRVFGIRTPGKRLLIPALNELASKLASLENDGPDQVALSQNNAVDFAAPELNALAYAGWWRAMHELYLAVESIANGTDGQPGRDGEDGRDGVDGQPGLPGLPGRDGSPGRDGAPGRDGVDGLDGLDGQPGRAGRDAAPGRDGSPGRDGLDGVDGLDGQPGQPGLPGLPGRDGALGRDGVDGVDGLDGQPGQPGLPGLPGRDGALGRDGVDGVDGLDGTDGQPGLPGLPGRDGTLGRDGLDGVDGLDGSDGQPGMPGLPGLPGRDGLGCDGADGADGLDGQPGMPGMPGMAGRDGWCGADGADGLDGEPGAAGSGLPVYVINAGEVMGNPADSGSGAAPRPLSGAQVGSLTRYSTNQIESTGGTFAPFVLTSSSIKRLVVTATSTFHGFAMVTSGTALENGMEFVVENGAAVGSGITLSFVQFSSSVAGGNTFKILLPTNFGTDAVGVVLGPGESQVFRYTDVPGVGSSARVRAVGPKTLASVISQGTTLGRIVLSGTGPPVPLTGLQLGQNVRRYWWIADNTTTGVVATYALSEETVQVIFTGSGTIQLEGATIIQGKEINWTIDVNASVVVTFMNDGASTITQERFRTHTQRQVTIRAGESVTTGYFLNRHRFISVSKRADPQLTSVVRDDFDGQCDLAGVLSRPPWIAWDAPTIAQADTAASGFHSVNHPGILHMQDDAALADEAAIYRGPWDFGNIATFGASIMIPADGGNELLNCAMGFGIVSDPTDMDLTTGGGVWTDNNLVFIHRSSGTGAGNWLLRRKNAGAAASVSSGVTVVAGTWATFRCEQTTPGSGSWRCYLNGAQFTTATLANTSGIAFLAIGMIRGAGAAGRNLLIDEVFLDTFEINRAAA